MLTTLERITYLGPAQILKGGGERVCVELPAELAWARVALAYPYQPAVGDTVLVIGHESDWYVIGVLRGRGMTTLAVPGDLRVQASTGTLELIAAHGVHIKSSVVKISAGRLSIMADTVAEQFAAATRWVQKTFHVHAGRLRTRVDSSYDLHAARLRARAEDDVKIDGRKIHLG